MAGSEVCLGGKGREAAARRAAAASLCALGATQVDLRITDAGTGSTASELGLAAPVFEDVPLCPAVVRRSGVSADNRDRYEVLLGSGTVHAAADARNVDGIVAWLLGAQGVQYRGMFLHIDSVQVDQFSGAPYLYRLTTTQVPEQ